MNENNMIPVEWIESYIEWLEDRGMPNMSKVVKRMIIAWKEEQDDHSSVQ